MGFYLRKSFSFGPARVNLSNSGLGLSVGVKGARLSVGPRGTQFNAGRGGLYYRQSLGGGHGDPAEPLPPAPNDDIEMTPIGSAPTDWSQSDEFVEQLRRCHSRMAATPWAIAAGSAVSLALALMIVPLDPLYWSFVALAAALTVVGAILLHRWDRRRLVLTVNYKLTDEARSIYASFVNAVTGCGQCGALWALTAQGHTDDWKRHAGVNHLLRRASASLSLGRPSRLLTDIPVYCLSIPTGRLVFLPDRALFYSGNAFRSIAYTDLIAESAQTRFVEDGSVPSDAQIVDHTWQYVNKDGGPDRRFANNRELPVCLYGKLRLTSTSGLEAIVQTSNADAPAQVAHALQTMRQMRRQALTGVDA